MKRWKLPGLLFACVLGLGYPMALTNLYFTTNMADLKPGISAEDIVAHYHGGNGVTRLTLMSMGSMRRNYKSEEELNAVIDWVKAGAKKEDYEKVSEIFENRCEKCHSSTGKMAQSPLTTFEEVSAFTKPDTGISWQRLALLSHQHLFGMGLLCFALSTILWRQTAYGKTLKTVMTLLGFAGMSLDISGWWLTKLYAIFAYQIQLGGMLMGSFIGLSILLIWWDFLTAKNEQPWKV
jgi:hypothetical protein